MKLWGQIWNGKKNWRRQFNSSKGDGVKFDLSQRWCLAPFFFNIPSISAFSFLKRRGNSREWGLRMYQKSPTWLKRKWDTWPSEVGLTGWEAWTASAFYWSGEANVSALHVKLNFTRISWYYQITIATIWNMIFWSYKYKGSLTGCFF